MNYPYFMLKDKVPVPCDTPYPFNHDRVVANTLFSDGVRVSTVFLVIDHGYGGGPPVLFETMIFDGEHDQYQTRCCTWEEAEEMHRVAVSMVNESPLVELVKECEGC